MKSTQQNITLLPYRERVKLVRERLANMRYPTITNLKKPARVLAAEKIVREWEEKDSAHCEAQRYAAREMRNEVHDALILGDMQKAVALLKKLDLTSRREHERT